MKRISKNSCMDFHVLKRFRQRFNVFFSQRDIDKIVSLITDCKTEPVFSLSNTKRVYIVNYNGLVFGCVYNKMRKRIHTVFPKKWIDDGSFVEHLLNTDRYEEVIMKENKIPCTISLNTNKRFVRCLNDE